VAVYSLFACRGSDLLAWVCPVAAGLPSAVECSWRSLSVMAGCLGDIRAVLQWGQIASAM
ncbi:hypothetical protein P7K49_039954, partial [Saguinus oedipus]